MQNGGEAQLATQAVLRVGAKLLEGLCHTLEKQVVDLPLVGPGQGIEPMR